MPLAVSIITPERAYPEQQADSVILPAFDGQVGILPRHAPFLCQLGRGKLILRQESQADRLYALKGGVAQVADDRVRILAESVVDVDEITEHDVLEELLALDNKQYDDGLSLAEARTKAHWLRTQLESKGKTVPQLKQLG